MFSKTIDFNKTFKPVLIAYGIIMAICIILTLIFGVNLDINFKGGTRISYSYTGELSTDKVEETIKGVTKATVTVTQSTALAGDTQTVTLSFAGRDSVDAQTQQKLTEAMEKNFADNKPALYDSTSVSPTVATAFFIKTMVAVLIAALLVVIYIGFRFRKIGGISAAITAFVALVLDVLIAFFTCTVFNLPIDSNFMAVVLTILGYSLNDTIVIYDRVRENKYLYPNMSLSENMDLSVSSTLVRNIVTTTTTVCAVLTIVVVAEVCGLTSLRSFAIPMAFGLVSGCVSSLFVSGPLWVKYKEAKAK